MAKFKFNEIAIAGISSVIPKNTIAVDSFKGSLNPDLVDVFKQKTGIMKLYRAKENQTASDLGFTAAKRLLEVRRVDISSIGIVVFVSKTPDYRKPATACVLHKRLELSKDCMAFDVNLGCAGYIFGIQVLSSLLESINTEFGLLVVGDTASKLLFPNNGTIALQFGDGASATLFEKRSGVEPLYVQTKSDGDYFKSYAIPVGGFRLQDNAGDYSGLKKGISTADYNIVIDEAEVENRFISEIPILVREHMANNKVAAEDYDCFSFNQFNRSVLKSLAETLGLPMEKVPFSLLEYGNTGASTIPLSLTEYVKYSKRGDIRVLASAFGEGFSWGLADFFVHTDSILPVLESDEYYTEGTVRH